MTKPVLPENVQKYFVNNGVLVLEGVAGIGKTYAIREVRALLEGGRRSPSRAELMQRIDELSDAFQSPEQHTELAKLNEWAGDIHQWLVRDCPIYTVDVSKCVMHPSTSYEEFIGGLRPDGSGNFPWMPGRFVRFLTRAHDANKNKEPKRFLIVLDEINRCNLASVLGELMYLIDPSRRITEPVSDAKRLENECLAVNVHPDATKSQLLWIPSNFFILGTMNSSDRSILGFDQALRRRFPPHRLEPFTTQDFKAFCTDRRGSLPAYDIAKVAAPRSAADIFCIAIHQYVALNCLMRFLIGPDAMVGQSYLLQALANVGFPKNSSANAFDGVDVAMLQNEINAAWRFGILPQVIHAVEAARRERVAEALTAGGKKAPDWLCQEYLPDSDDESFDDAVAMLKEAIEAVGLRDVISYDELLKTEAEIAAKQKPAREANTHKVVREVLDKLFECLVTEATQGSQVRLTGHGHGARLVVA